MNAVFVQTDEKERAEPAGPGDDGAALADWRNCRALQLPNADNKEVSVTDKGKLGGGMMMRRSGAAELSARLTGSLSGLVERRPRKSREETMSFRYRRPVSTGAVDFHSSL